MKSKISNKSSIEYGLDISSLRITEREETIVRKVTGYIPYTLKKQYRSFKAIPESSIILKIIESWDKSQVDNETVSLIEYSNDWADRINSGGLFTVTGQFLQIYSQFADENVCWRRH